MNRSKHDGAGKLDGLRVLCVEDDTEARTALARFLARRGAAVMEAANGEEGLARFAGFAPHLVISDIRMPRMDGLAMCRAMRERDPDVALILITAHEEKHYLAESIDLGVVKFLVKPVDFAPLKDALAGVVSRLVQRGVLVAANMPLIDASAKSEDERLQAFVDNYLGGGRNPPPAGIRQTQISSEAISGDFSAFASFGELTYGLVADGTGHGLTALLPVLPIPRVFREMASRGFSLTTIADEINRKLHAYQFPGHFLAATLFCFDAGQRSLEVLNCGSPPALLLDDAGAVRQFASSTLALGLADPDAFDIAVERCEVGAAQRLFVFTDGLADTLAATHVQWDRGYFDRLPGVVGAAGYYERLANMLAESTRLARVQDDVTLVEFDFAPRDHGSDGCDGAPPVAAGEPVPVAPSPPNDAALAERLKSCTVLIVEDDTDARELLSRVVSRRVAKVITARNGAEGLKLFAQYRPQLVLADIVMPDMDGLTMIERIRKIDTSVQVILTSGSIGGERLDMALELRVARFLPKPIDVGRLLESIQDGVRQFDSFCGDQLSSVVFVGSSLAMTVTNARREIVAVNPAFTRLTGYERSEVVGRNPRMFSSGKHSPAFYEAMWTSLYETGRWSGEIWNRRKNGELFLEWLSINAVRDESGEVTQYVSVFADITERSAAEEKLHQLSHFDSVTQLPNRVLLMDRINQAIARAQRERSNLAVFFMDVDHFKTINDTLGHSAGDSLLVTIAETLRECVRESDTIGRFGGDEFAILLPNAGTHEAIARVAGKILGRVAQPCTIAGNDIQTSLSIGISLYPDDGSDAETLVKNADNAMYYAKAGGRSGFRFFSRQHGEQAQRDLAIQQGIRSGLKREEFSMAYQPKYSLGSRRIVGAEALIRWHSPALGNVSPVDFIPIAEKTGVIVDVGEWVIGTVCAQIARWRDAGIEAPPVAINISPLHFQRGKVMSTLLETLATHGLPPGALQVELTEGVVMNDSDTTRAMLSELRERGFKISIDDFGTGYSSLGYLRQLPIDEIKIDRSFIKEIDEDVTPAETAVPLAVMQLARSLGLQLVAEGVETEVQTEFLVLNGCDVIQGYLFSKPLPAADFAAMLIRQRERAVSPPL